MGKAILGIDIGGTGIKGAIVDVKTGEMLTERAKLPTPPPALPSQVTQVVKTLVDQLDYKGNLIGFGFPSIVKDGVCKTASNIDNSWIGTDLNSMFSQALGKQCIVINDADAAGIAELQFGEIGNVKGTVILLTLGTGIGSALFIDGKLVPNTEFGHLKFKESIAEKYTSNKVREVQDLSYKQFGVRLSKYLSHLEHIFSPSYFILGGGVSKKLAKYQKELDLSTPVVAATKLNNAGIIGAAYYAQEAK